MEIVCQSCATRLSIPDERLPVGVPSVTGKCPKCQSAIEIKIPSADRAAPHAPPAAPPPETFAAPLDEDFSGDRRLAIVCFNDEPSQAAAKAALEALNYTVHVPAKPEEAIGRLRRNKYEVLVLHEEYGGGAAQNVVLKAIGPMAMALRRHMCIGLVGKGFYSMDNMMAFARSVNFVVAERELDKLKGIARQAVADNDQFYAAFREALKEAGKV
ncbi:MAG: hypothetical protein HY554_06820 [Elusimicrobia bacterium]|nr:hypothetical protein [Elusimicrobiota bacterium]